MLFDGLMTQNEISRLLDETFDGLGEAAPSEEEDVVLTGYEVGENADHVPCSPLETAFVTPSDRSTTGAPASSGSFFTS